MSAQKLHAALTWSRLCEPGDRVASAIIRELGQVEGLRFAQHLMHGFATHEHEIARVEELALLGVKVVARHLKRWNQRNELIDVETDIRRSKLLGAKILYPGHPQWPSQVLDLYESVPYALWLRGDSDSLSSARTSLSLVGSRASTAYGDHGVSMALGALETTSGVVVSGGAFGIDVSAHRQALARGITTVGVMAGGIDRLYPAGNNQVLSRLSAGECGGAVVSEAPPGTLPMKSRFLSRNRLIAALSNATVVVEAAWRSGSLSTAHHALEIGRSVGAVPGPITSAQSAGCHRLIQESGASVITCEDDVLQLLMNSYPLSAAHGATPADSVIEAETAAGELKGLKLQRVIDLSAGAVRVHDAFMRSKSATAHELAQRSGMLESEVIGFLGELEMRGVIARDLFGWRLISN